VATDQAGNVVVTGEFRGTVDFGGGPRTSCGGGDVFLAKYDASGNHLWSLSFGGELEDSGRSVAVDAEGNILLAGWFCCTIEFGGDPMTANGCSDIFVAKFDSDGRHLWSRGFGGRSADAAHGVVADEWCDVFLAGYFEGTVSFGGGPLTSFNSVDAFLVKLDSEGDHLWSRRFGEQTWPVYGDAAAAVDVDGAGCAVITGRFGGTIEFGDNVLTSSGSDDIFLAKFDRDGSHLWSQRFGDAATDDGVDVAVTAPGQIVLTGMFYDDIDFGGGLLHSNGWDDIFVASYDAEGRHLWSHGFGHDGWDEGRGVALDASGHTYLTGVFGGTVDFGGGPLTSAGMQDAIVARFDAGGHHVWSQGFGDIDLDFGSAVDAGAFGDVSFLGAFTGAVDFGGGLLFSAGCGDVFVARYGDGTTAVEVLSFEARVSDNAVTLRWDTGWPGEATGYHVLRSASADRVEAVRLTSAPVRGGTGVFEYRDQHPPPGCHHYWLEEVRGGEIRRHGPCEVHVPPVGTHVTLAQNVPNPFRGSTEIAASIPIAERARLGIYDVAGRLRRTIVIDGSVGAGECRVIWDGTDAKGQPLPAGVYCYRLSVGSLVVQRKLQITR
jgi:hypothetical protein